MAEAVSVVDATPDRWEALADLLGQPGDASRCWCQFFAADHDYGDDSPVANRAALHAQVMGSDAPRGVLALTGSGLPVGWCAVGVRSLYPRLARLRVAKATTDEDGLWSVTCFVVRTRFRRQGLSGELLDGAVSLARRYGARTLEAYPVDAAVSKASASGMYYGPLSIYLAAGFTEVARPTPSRAVVRLPL